jgi:hypothetical protein
MRAPQAWAYLERRLDRLLGHFTQYLRRPSYGARHCGIVRGQRGMSAREIRIERDRSPVQLDASL